MIVSSRPYDEALLRLAFDVARRSRATGDHPFGSVLADALRPRRLLGRRSFIAHAGRAASMAPATRKGSNCALARRELGPGHNEWKQGRDRRGSLERVQLRADLTGQELLQK
jgi:hypothetical protein